ncbi:MAG: carboxypeptidase-like regulatory domain-containing protein [Candidatus Woesearchaeota archaeon]
MKTSKQMLFLTLFFVVFCSEIVFSFGSPSPNQFSDIGCCVSPDYSTNFDRSRVECEDLGGIYFDQLCEDLPYLNIMGCCVDNSSVTGNKCAYSTQAWCQNQGANFITGMQKEECSDYEYSFSNCKQENILPENCTEKFGADEKCINNTIFYCDKTTGELTPNCILCNNCAPFVCDKSTGKCDLNKIESELTGETRNCCYFEEQCPQEQRNASLQCPTNKPIGCNVECTIFPCKLGFKINSNDNKQKPLCWCGNKPYNTSTEEGYCCGESFEDSYYLTQMCGSAIGIIYGYIKNSSGNGIKNARVIVTSQLSQRLSPPSNTSGFYEIKDLIPGDYSLIAIAFDYNPSQQSINLIDSSEVNFTLYKPGEQQCIPKSVNLTYFAAQHVKGKPFVKLEWNLNQLGCENIISSFIIKRNDWGIAKYVSGNERSFIDEETSWGTTYNYSIQILFKVGSLSNILYAEITTGDSICENVFEGQEFCYNPETGQKKGNANYRRTCDENNKISEYVSNAPNAGTNTDCENYNQICVVLKNKKTDCKPKSNCLIKGLPLGLFFSIPSCIQDFCVYDYSTTNVDACYDCTKFESGQMFLKTCYDFNSEFACKNNNCNLDCTWKYTNLEFNRGICYPIEQVENESACDVCNQLFMHCTSEDCSLLGNCYKNKDSLCINCDGVRCEDFSDRFSCEGNSLTQSVCGFNFSNDACNLRICRWNYTTNSCFKDGNYDGIPDCGNKEGEFRDLCISDTQPPRFTINAQQPLDSLVISKDTDEIKLTAKEDIIDFSYCFDTTNTCCPEKQLNIFQNRNVVFKPKVDEKDYIQYNSNNIYYFRYKAIDTNFNIAPIESIKMFVIAQPFNFNLTYGFYPKEDGYDLMIMAQTSRPAKCSYELTPNVDTSLNYTNFGTYTDSFVALFSGIAETSFNAKFTCYDEVGNEIIFTPNSFKISYFKDGLINITITTPYYQSSTPIVSWGDYEVNIKVVPGVTINKVRVDIKKEGNIIYFKDLNLKNFDSENGIYYYTLTLDKNSDDLVKNLREVAGYFDVDAVYNGVKVKTEYILGKEFAIYTGLPKPTITIT